MKELKEIMRHILFMNFLTTVSEMRRFTDEQEKMAKTNEEKKKVREKYIELLKVLKYIIDKHLPSISGDTKKIEEITKDIMKNNLNYIG